MKYDDWFLLDHVTLYGFIIFTFVGSRLKSLTIDFKHPTNQGLLYFSFLAIMALAVIISIYFSDVSYYFY